MSTNELELSVIGVMIKSPDLIDLVASRLKPSDFLNPASRAIYQHLLELSETGQPVHDIRFVSDSLRSRSLVGDEITSVRSDDLRMAVDQSLSSHADNYCDQMVYWSQVRDLRRLQLELSGKLSSEYVDVQAICSEVISAVESMTQRERLKTTTLADASAELLRSIVNRSSSQARGSYCNWGIYTVDQGMMPMSAGDLVLFCGRSSEGKTAGSMQIMLHNAMHGKRCLFVSMEQKAADLALRVLAGETGIHHRSIRYGELDNDELELLYAQLGRQKAAHIEIFDGGRVDVRKVRTLAKLVAARGGLDLLVVDYLQLLNHSNHKLQRHEKIDENVHDLKDLALELEIPVIALAQFNRKASEGVPDVSHIEGSGAAEKAADFIVLIHNKGEAGNNSDRSASWNFAKVRNGEKGQFELTWSPSRTKFMDLST